MDCEAFRQRLETLAERLRAAGQVAIADELTGFAAEVQASVASWPCDLLTPTEAASTLGVRSVNTIKRWARDGQLEGYHIGGRVLVSRRSVEAFQQTAALRRQRTYEHDLDAALTPFDGTEEEIADLRGEPMPGRVPWGSNATAAV